MNEEKNYLDRAKHNLDAARNKFEEAEYLTNGYYYGGAANRLYYSMFHAVSALFCKDALNCKTHKGSHVLFMKEYVFAGKLPNIQFQSKTAFHQEKGCSNNQVHPLQEWSGNGYWGI